MSRRIRFAETAADGHAYFATYIRLMEETEYAFLRSRGLRVVLKDDRGIIGFPRLTARINVEQPAVFEQIVTTRLELKGSDGKQIEYHFELISDELPVATGRFVVACCRFPEDKPPFAILTPDHILNALGC